MKTKKKTKTVKLPKIGDEIVAVKIVGGEGSDYSGKVIHITQWGDGAMIRTEAGEFYSDCLLGTDPDLNHYAVKPKPAKKKTSAGPKVWVDNGCLVIVINGGKGSYCAVDADGKINGHWLKDTLKGAADVLACGGFSRVDDPDLIAYYLKTKDGDGFTWQTAR